MPTLGIIERSHVVIKSISQRVIQAHQITTDVKLHHICHKAALKLRSSVRRQHKEMLVFFAWRFLFWFSWG